MSSVQERQSVMRGLRAYLLLLMCSFEGYCRKNGELFYNQFSIRPLFDRYGRLIYYPGTQFDVSEAVRAQEELRRLNALLANADG